MNSCPSKEKLIAYRLDMLDGEEKHLIEVHLRECAACQQEFQIESIIDQELTQALEPGQIEQLVLARVRLLRDFQPQTSLLDYIKGGLYAAAFSIIGLVVCTWIFDLPYSRILNIIPKLDYSFDPTYYTTLFTSNLIIFLAIGAIFTIASSAYTLIYIRRQ